MTVQTVPAYLQNASHSAAVFRQAVSAVFSAPGILGVGELAISQQATPNMSIILGAGRAMVAGSQVSPPAGLAFTTQAMYQTLNDGAISLTVTTANGTNPRIDAVYIGVQDAYYSGANNQAVAGIVAGVPAASPVAPSIPVNSLLLGYIAVGAGVSSIVTANITSTATLVTLTGTAGPNTPHFRYQINAALNATTTLTPIAWDTLSEGALAGFTYASGVFTCAIPGVYSLAGAAMMETGSGVDVQVHIQRNGSDVIQVYGTSGGQFESITFAVPQRFAIGDALTIALKGSSTQAMAPGTATYISVDYSHA